MDKVKKSAITLAKASNGNPVVSTATIILFFIMFNLMEAAVEKLLFGDRFEHWLDPIFVMMFIAYAAYSVWWCAIINEQEKP